MRPSYSQLRRHLASTLAEFLDPLEAHAEATRWLEEGLGRNRSWLAAHGQEEVTAAEAEQIQTWLQRRREGEPWAYLLGWTTFRGHRFEVDRHTLIPRPETEMLLDAALDVGRRLDIRRVCDVGTGTGILAISLALESSWQVTATDISPATLEVAQRNARTLKADVAFQVADLLDGLVAPVELVVSNPPYVDPADEPTLQRELTFEPRLALFAPDRGLAVSTELLRQARQRGARGCLIEIGAGQGSELQQRATELGWARVAVHKDLAGHDRLLMALG